MWHPFKKWSALILAIMTNKYRWSWASNSACKYVNLRIDMRDGSAVMSVIDHDGKSHSIDPKLLSRQYRQGGDRFEPIPTLEELGIDCSDMKE
jgi:hypothetical protein